MNAEYAITSLAASLGDGQHSGLACPECGPFTSDRAMSMLVDGTAIKAICHRASCGFRWSTGAGVSRVVSRPSRARPYTGALRSLDASDTLWLSERFRMAPSSFVAMRKSGDRYFLPIVGPEGTRRGWVARMPWEGSPLSRSGDQAELAKELPKVLTYMDNEEPVQSWEGNPRCERTVVLVEDQISALRLNRYVPQFISIALLGTGLNEEKVAEIQRYALDVLIALDADATGQAFSHARKWGAGFRSCHVVILSKDVKDSTNEEISDVFDRWT
jgi:hypothetical protein